MGKRMQTKHRGRWFYLMLCVLLAFLAVPLCVSAVVFFNAMKISNERMESSLSALLEVSADNASRSSLDDEFFREAADFLEEGGLVDELVAPVDTDVDPIAEAEMRLEALEGKVGETDGAAHRILLYLSHADRIVASSGDDSTDGYLGDLADELAAAGLFDDIEGLAVDRSKATTDLLVGADGEKSAVRVQHFQPGIYLLYYKPGGPEEAELFQSVKAVDANAEAGFFDRFGNLHAYHDEQSILGQLSYNDLGSAPEGVFRLERDGSTYIVCYTRFADADTAFVVAIEDIVAGAERGAFVSIIVALALLLMVGATVAVAFSRKIYSPLGRLLSRFEDKKSISMADNEFGVIAEGISTLDDVIKRQERTIEQGDLRAMLHGYRTSTGDEDECRYFFQESDALYSLVGIRLDGSTVSQSTRSPASQNVESVAHKVRDWLAEKGFGPFVSVEDNAIIVLIVGMGDRRASDLIGHLEQLREHALSEGLYLSLFISEPADSGIDAAKSFDEIMRMLAYCSTNEIYNIVLSYETYCAEQPDRVTRGSLDMLGDLSRAVSAASKDRALRSFDRLVRLHTVDSTESAIAGQDLSLLSSTICLAIYSSRKAAYLPKKDIDEMLDRVARSRNLTELRTALIDSLDGIERLACKEGSDGIRFKEIREFVDRHITDQNLSSAMVARHFETSQSNITRIFKKYAKFGFLEYVHRERIARAQELLDGTDATVAEVSTAVGFTNVLTMSRAFKRYAGITPTEYRKK